MAEYVNRDELFNAIDVTTWYHQNSNKDINIMNINNSNNTKKSLSLNKITNSNK